MDTLTHEPASPGEGGWHLAPADHALVAAKSRVNRLRFAVMLLFFRDRGRFPRGADILDPEAMARLASASTASPQGFMGGSPRRCATGLMHCCDRPPRRH